MGLLRNLSAGEILGQVRAARSAFGANVRNVVFMGMGEPMDNLDNVIAAIIALHEDHARQIPRRRITVSTVGRCAGIRRLAALGWRRLNLAVSLNAPNDEIRSRIMPINRAEPMAELRRAIAAYPVRAGGHVLIEYVLIKGLNDRLEHAAELVEYLRGLRTCVNLIPMNPIDDEPFDAPAGRAKLPLSRSDAHDGRAKLPLSRFEAPDDETVERFQLALMNAGQLAFRRNTKGRRAMAACGQLGNPGLRRGSAQQPEVACVR
jgi:23S rRNA (adenine2503-C2)-methyltransferase